MTQFVTKIVTKIVTKTLTQIEVDGAVVSSLPDAKWTAESLLSHLGHSCQKEGWILSSVTIDGKEILDVDPSQVPQGTLPQIDRVKIKRARPIATARETLISLCEYAPIIAQACRDLAPLVESADASAQRVLDARYPSLLDGIRTHCEAIVAVKRLLGLRNSPEVEVLEVDLLSIINDLLEARRTQDRPYTRDILAKHLPQNLEDWATMGIPALLSAIKD